MALVWTSFFGNGGGSAAFGSHRYWRVHISAVSSGNLAAITELQMYEGYFGQNLITGGTVAADSNFVDYPASSAVDGGLQDTAASSNTSVWASANSSLPHWLSYDFGSAKAITAVGIHGRVASQIAQMPTDLTVQYSDDNSTWTTAWSHTGLSWSSFEYKRLSQNSAPPHSGSPHGSHSYWRIFVNQPEGTAAIAITELEFRATPGGGDQASGGSGVASSTFSGSFPVSQAFDNSGSTFWHNGSSIEWAWVRYDFASPVSVAQIAITARNTGSPVAGPTNIAIQYADSSSGPWTTAWNVIGEAAWSLSEVRTFTDPNYV